MKQLALTINGTPVQPPQNVPSGGLNRTGENIITAFVNLLFLVAAVLAIIYLILGGIRWITSGGDPKGVEAARKQITYAILGLVIVVLAYLIVNLVGNFLGGVKLLGEYVIEAELRA